MKEDVRNLSDKCLSCPYRKQFGLYQCLTEAIDGIGESCSVPWDILDEIERRRNDRD